MKRSNFDAIWVELAKDRDWDIPFSRNLDFHWACMGVVGREGCPVKFRKALMQEDSKFAEILCSEVEHNLN